MGRIRKTYFTLDELVAVWRFPEADLRYVAENGLLRLSVRVVGPFMEFGCYGETTEGESFSVPCEHRHHDGLLDLHKRDVFALFRDGSVQPWHFPQPDGGYACLLRDEDQISFRRADLLVRQQERVRFEAAVLPTLREAQEATDFTNFLHNDRWYRFTPTQARVLLFLFDAAAAGAPWQSGKAALAACGSHSLKPSDLFKRHPEWRDLIEADGRGSYRLTPALTQRRAA